MNYLVLFHSCLFLLILGTGSGCASNPMGNNHGDAMDAGDAESKPLLLQNPSFEANGESLDSFTSVDSWSGSSHGGVSDNSYYNPPDGKYFAWLGSGDGWIQQKSDALIEKDKQYRLTLYARSINPAGTTDKTLCEVAFLAGDTGETLVASTTLDVNVQNLKGAPAELPSDDGANVWVHNGYRHQLNQSHFYQPIASDPIMDPWRVFDSTDYYETENELGFALGNVQVGDTFFLYGTIYDDSSEDSLYSSIWMSKGRASGENSYTWSEPVLVIENSKSEFPWVEDAHLYYDAEAERLWMSWGGNDLWVVEMDPQSGMVKGNPSDKEVLNNPQYHTKIVSFEGDDYSSNWIEGPALWKRGQYWYAMGSYGHLGKNYNIRIGRGASPTGPFFDKDNVRMTEKNSEGAYGNTMLLGDEAMQLVPGHPHFWEENGQTYMGYDYRSVLNSEEDRMGIRKIAWVNDWPTVYMPITVEFSGADHPELIGKPLSVAFRNKGGSGSTLAVDHVEVFVSE